MTENYSGSYRGIVTNNNDLEGLNRIKAVCPQVFGDGLQETGWAWPMVDPSTVVLYSNGNPGIPQLFTRQLATPEPGQGVWLTFEGGDIEYPIWTGVWS
jgi:hypothetical protein